MAGIIAVYGLVVSVLIVGGRKSGFGSELLHKPILILSPVRS